jgi:hypothetical protein
MAVQLLRQLQFGANAIGARNQNRFAIFAGQIEQGTEAAQTAHDFGPKGALYQRFDAFNHFISGIDIYAGVTISQGSLGCHGNISLGKCLF